MDVKEYHVFIFGAGIAGLCAAKAFQDLGIKTTIIEKHYRLQKTGAGIAIPAHGTWALQQLGISLKNKAKCISAMNFSNEKAEILSTVSVENIHHEKSSFFSIDRASLLTLPQNNLKNSEILFSHHLTTIKNTP